MSKPLIYLASPYSHPNQSTRELRFYMVCEFAARLANAGHLLFCPIAHTHPMERYGLPSEWAFWRRFDQPFIDKCDELWVLMLPGWSRSTGVQYEIGQFLDAHKPIKYLEFDWNEEHTNAVH